MLARHPFLRELAVTTLIGIGVYAVCVLIVLIAEKRERRDFSAYRRRSALNDLGYVVFYKCSIYSILVMPLFAFLSPRLQFLHIDLLQRLPWLASVLLAWLAFDFVNYWIHRLQHSSRLLWAFHSVHHATTELTFLSSHRTHFLEQLATGLLLLVPALVLGIPQRLWFPILFLQLLSETCQHARLSWNFGPLHALLVSPTFHSMHHSVDEQHYNTNYGRVFSIWDWLFGTFIAAKEPVQRVGVEGMEIPERLTAQFAHPFRFLASR